MDKGKFGIKKCVAMKGKATLRGVAPKPKLRMPTPKNVR